VSALLRVAAAADGFGLRSLVARAASLVYPGHKFEVDAQGYWINHQLEATFVSPSIHTAGYSEIEAAALNNWAWEYRPQLGDTVMDVGAGIGEETVVFSRLVGSTGRIVAIEAHPETFACLKSTIERSGLRNVTAVNCAVTDQDGELCISTGPSHLAPSHLMNTILNAAGGNKVKAQTLDTLAEELGVRDVALLKMNIEGAEKMAVEGFDRLAPKVRHAVVSCHDFVATHFGGAPHYFTKNHVRAALQTRGFMLRSRPDAAESWIRDYLYASR
jgi:FkbM family methyltransferase